MAKELPLGINIHKMIPYNVIIVDDSISERKLLRQYFKSAEFNILELGDELVSYAVGHVLDGEGVDKHKAETDTAESADTEPLVNTDDFLKGIEKADILCMEYRLNTKASDIIEKIKTKYPRMKLILVIKDVQKKLIDEILKIKASAYLVKPVSKTTIYDKLKTILKRNDLDQKIVVGFKPGAINLHEIQIPPLPKVLSRVILFDADKVGGSEELEEIVSPDKGLSADFLRVANSAFYGRSGQVNTLKEAITLMGLKTINNIVIVKFKKRYSRSLKDLLFVKYLDEVPVLTGLIALDLTAPLHLSALNNEIFIHSVLMKIGMTILAINQPQRYLQILKYYDQGSRSLIQLEKEEFNTDFIQLGSRIFKLWHLPRSMQEVVQNQEFTINRISEVNDIDRLLRISEIFALKLMGMNIREEEMQLLLAVLKLYNAKTDIIGLFNEEYYSHIKSHPFFDLI